MKPEPVTPLTIPRSNYEPCYWTHYVFTWDAPHPHDPVDLWLTRGKLGCFAVAGTCLAAAGGIKLYVVCGGPTMGFAVTPHVTQQTCNVSFQVCGGAWLRGAPAGVIRLEAFKPGFWCLKDVPILNSRGVVLLGRAGKPVLISQHPCLSAAIEAFLRGLRCF